MRIHISTAAFGQEMPSNKIFVKSNLHTLSQSSETNENTFSRHLALHPRLKGKIPKMLAHRFHDADWYFWIDSKFEIKNPLFLDEILSQAPEADLILYPHYSRGSISEELEYMCGLINNGDSYLLNRYSGEPISEQVSNYVSDTSFHDEKLFAMGFFGYNRKCIPLMEEWFMHNCIWSIQDQLSFPYVLQKNNHLKVKEMPGNILDNEHIIHDSKLKKLRKKTAWHHRREIIAKIIKSYDTIQKKLF